MFTHDFQFHTVVRKACARAPNAFLKRESGSVILNVVIGMAVISALSLAFVNMYQSVRKVQAKVDFLNAVSQIQLTISNTANDANSWKSTTSDSLHNGAMSCIANQTCTTLVPATGFVLWPAGASSFVNLTSAVYDGLSPTSGFTLLGQPCSTFSLSGNAACPIHANMTWSTTGCSPAPCDAPVTVTSDILYRPGSTSVFGSINESQYTLNFPQKSNTSSDPCAGSVPILEASICAAPPYGSDGLVCTGSGYRCGQVYH